MPTYKSEKVGMIWELTVGYLLSVTPSGLEKSIKSIAFFTRRSSPVLKSYVRKLGCCLIDLQTVIYNTKMFN